MKLTARLKVIADLIPINSRVGDIGTDHGFLPVYLVENGISDFCIATDLNEGPVNNALKTIKKSNCEEKINVRLGPGLLPYKDGEIDVAVIAGMGGVLISQILSDSIDIAKKIKVLILQPMIGQKELRRWLEGNNFEILGEKIAIEGSKIYEIIVVTSGHMKIENDFLYEFGPKLIFDNSIEAKKFIFGKHKKYLKIKKALDDSGKNVDRDYYMEIIEKINFLEELL